MAMATVCPAASVSVRRDAVFVPLTMSSLHPSTAPVHAPSWIVRSVSKEDPTVSKVKAPADGAVHV